MIESSGPASDSILSAIGEADAAAESVLSGTLIVLRWPDA